MSGWLEQHENEPSEVVAERLWTFWATLSPTETLALPTPGNSTQEAFPNVPPVVEWFYAYCTEGNLRQWPTIALEFESRRQKKLEQPPDEWTIALDVRELDATAMERELHRRGRSAARRAAELEVTPESVASSLLGSAYHAFFAGRLERAEELVRAVVDRYPSVAGGQNNLGFLLLIEGRYEEAQTHLERAAQLDYDLREVLDFNVACCRYALGDFGAALEGFRGCLAHPSISDAVLCVVTEEALNPIALTSAADYVALTALNAGWAALRGGARGQALEYLQIARSGLQTASTERQEFVDRSAREIFTTSFERLQQRLSA
jgi:tetratricopeptide (TPR) repeat protein